MLAKVGARTGIGVALSLVALAASAPAASSTPKARRAVVAVVAGENEYGNVASQIGGRYVTVYSVESDPNTDPHAYEVTPSVAQKVSTADLLIENGLGYDTFMGTLAAASPNRARKVIDVQRLLRLPDSLGNPHLWYDPRTMPAVAEALAADLSALDPADASIFRSNERKFVASLRPWLHAIAAFRAAHRGITAATTEPVADDLLRAMGIENLTPFRFQ
ncbi:MAG: metal ABC transporter solute-binding protein, Zn/Mn family, partial [Acidimicrobiales bacterium]